MRPRSKCRRWGKHCAAFLHLTAAASGTTVACRIKHNGAESAVVAVLQGLYEASGAPSALIGVAPLEWIGSSAAP